jgi:prefoldin subunit 5
LDEAEARIEKLEKALERIRDYHSNWAQSMRQIAQEALE